MDQLKAASGKIQKKPRRLTRKRKWLFRGLALLGSVFVIELLSWLGLWLFIPNYSSLWFLHERQHALAIGHGLSEASAEVIHPYLGWVHDPQIAGKETVLGSQVSVNALGFQDNADPLTKWPDNTFVVAILGGSVAWHAGITGSPTIRRVLEADPLFAGKTVEVVVLAKSGYKQPQQLLAYNYLAALGAEFDAIVNIDGYNEAVLSVSENFAEGTSIAYPRAWHARAIQLVDPRNSAEALELLKLRAHRQTMARRMNNSLLKWSPTMNLAWHLRDARAQSQLQRLAVEVFKNRSGRFIHHGPADSFASEEELHRGVVDLWFRSSLELHKSCVASGRMYVHILQPNQYHTGSKPMGQGERYVAFLPNSHSDKPIRKIYPLFIEAGRQLANRGVNFSDQTRLFADIEEPIYIDGCCHYNEKGNAMLAQKIAEELLAALRRQNVDRRN
jgi:hypothetical protein